MQPETQATASPANNPVSAPAIEPANEGRNGVRLVVGGNRGIGLALVRAQLKNRAVKQVVATCRDPSAAGGLNDLRDQHGDRLALLQLDVTDSASLAGLSDSLARLDGGLDLAIHAAGMLHDEALQPEKSVSQCSAANLLRLFEVNSIGPLMVAEAVLRVQPRKRVFTFAALSAMVGSIADNRLGGWYGYRASKTALNQFIKTLANECRVSHPRGAVVAIHPGTTDTDLSRPFQGNVPADKLYSPDQTALRILDVLGGIDQNQSGRFLNWDGRTIPW
jgi:NAD(P)-dependent dehydrogenase (short-subunit alcohol dehydrogenase family)